MRKHYTTFTNNNFSVLKSQAEKLILLKKQREAAEDFALEYELSKEAVVE